MKKILKFLLFILALVVIGIVTFYTYLLFVKIDRMQPLQAVASDAVFVIESENLTKGWKEVKESQLWDHILESDYLEEYEADMMAVDSLMAENPFVRKVFKDRPLALSFNMLDNESYDMLFVVDIGKYGKLSLLPQLAGMFNYELNTYPYKYGEIYGLTYGDANEVIHLAVHENLLIGSLCEEMVERSLETLHTGKAFAVDKFTQVQNQNDDGLVNLYLNYALLDDFVGVFFPEMKENLNSVSNILAYSALVTHLKDKNIALAGFTNYYDTVPSVVDALVKADAGEMEAHLILPSQTALLMDLNIDDFDRFYMDFMDQFSAVDPEGFKAYEKNMRMSEKWLGIDFDEVLFPWLAGEFAVAKLRPESNARELDVLLAVKANDLELAKEGLGTLVKHIRKRTPVKFDQVNYRNHEIYLLNMKGFFKLFFGQFMADIEKPYFTYLDDYVVFSNSVNSLMGMVDDYLVGNTLARNPGFSSFLNRFGNEGNFSVFVQMPKVYQHMYYYSDYKARKSLKKNKNLLVNFAHIGWQLKATGDMFETSLLAQHDEKAMMYEELEEMQKSAEDLFVEEYRELKFKIFPDETFPWNEGHVDYWGTHPERVQDSVIVHEGEMRDSLLQGLWRTYYPTGNIRAAVPYDDGKVEGTAVFYYDDNDHTVKAEVDFEEDVLDGSYKEYYSNGRTKAELTANEGVFHGEGLYYYRNGQVKIEGKYKKGKRNGKWKHYTKAGELISKETWRR
ncbi:DUF3352 domain-containing protein [Marinilabiliaceae bacterium JC017]|nr:DUF3352 domain-containing protein [Marinilabiliaceae bacterium JC017]